MIFNESAMCAAKQAPDYTDLERMSSDAIFVDAGDGVDYLLLMPAGNRFDKCGISPAQGGGMAIKIEAENTTFGCWLGVSLSGSDQLHAHIKVPNQEPTTISLKNASQQLLLTSATRPLSSIFVATMNRLKSAMEDRMSVLRLGSELSSTRDSVFQSQIVDCISANEPSFQESLMVVDLIEKRHREIVQKWMEMLPIVPPTMLGELNADWRFLNDLAKEAEMRVKATRDSLRKCFRDAGLSVR